MPRREPEQSDNVAGSSSVPSDRSDLERRLAFLELGDEDRQRLREMAPRLKESASEFVEAFYRHLFKFEETAKFLQDGSLVERLKGKQQSHLESMLEANWDEGYADRRRRVGDAHAQIGINPQMLLGAYSQYLQFVLRQLAGNDRTLQQFTEQVLSLLKAIFFDVELTLDAYFMHSTHNLRQALDLVFRANAELKQFAQFTSHDLKTPLATVANLCDEALDEFKSEIPAEAQTLIAAARNRAFSMSKTIDELLKSTISLESGESQQVSTQHAIQEAVQQVLPLIDHTGIQIKTAPNLPDVWGDKVRIREAFYNLLTNAAKFSSSSTGRIAIDVEVHGDDCVFSVSDNGPGIPREELTRIFVPFRRLPMHHDVPGSGLGLYFTKTIVEQQGGRIWAESELDHGACFYVLLRRYDSNTAPRSDSVSVSGSTPS